MAARRLSTAHTYVTDFRAPCACGNTASWWMTIHNVGDCHTTPTVTALLCETCRTHTLFRLGAFAARAATADYLCTDCGCTVDSYDSLVTDEWRL